MNSSIATLPRPIVRTVPQQRKDSVRGRDLATGIVSMAKDNGFEGIAWTGMIRVTKGGVLWVLMRSTDAEGGAGWYSTDGDYVFSR